MIPQAYVIDITLSDDSKYTVFRRFNEFHDMNQKLEERFPVDAGYFNYGQRTLPEVPAKILFGRSAVRNVAEQRLPQLNEYLKVRRYESVVSSPAILLQGIVTVAMPTPVRIYIHMYVRMLISCVLSLARKPASL